ncbi:MAG: CvpA family protein [Balneolaceae bacterium]
MNVLDFIILIPILFFAYRGYFNGLIMEVFSIAGIIAGLFATILFLEPFSLFLARFFGGPSNILTIVCGALLFISALILVHLLAVLLQRFIEAIQLKLLNRLFGSLFAGLKCAIVISAFLFLFSGLNLPSEEAREESVSYYTIIWLAPATYDLIAGLYPGAADFVTTTQRMFEESDQFQNLPNFTQ